jgi:hypothetical protein
MSRPSRSLAIAEAERISANAQGLYSVAEIQAKAIAAYVRARNDGGVSMADLSSIADCKLREAHTLWNDWKKEAR